MVHKYASLVLSSYYIWFKCTQGEDDITALGDYYFLSGYSLDMSLSRLDDNSLS